jgi:hypothetical protein
MHPTDTTNRGEEEDEGDPLEEDDPLSVLIDRISAVKASFEDFHSRLLSCSRIHPFFKKPQSIEVEWNTLLAIFSEILRDSIKG